jgi:anti-sigma factor RsiW
MRWFRHRALVCRDAVALMSDYLDRRLPSRDARRLERHLVDCPHCHEYLEQLRVSIDVLGRVVPEDLSPEALDDLVAVYRRWQQE